MTKLTTTANSTQPLICSAYPVADKIGKTFAYCIIIVVSLTGNILIGTIVFKIKSTKKPIKFLILNMATSDLIFPISVFSRLLAELYVDYWLVDGTFGLAMCKLAYYLQDVSTAVSIQSLVLIAVDRFVAVVFPFRPPFTSTKLRPFYILATWIVAMAIHSPYPFARKLSESSELLSCQLKWQETFGKYLSLKSYCVALFLVLAVIPFAQMTILYSIIVVKLKSQNIPGGESATAKEHERRPKRDGSVLEMVLSIVLGFALCWAPFNVFAFRYFFVWDKNEPLTCGLLHFRFFALFMAYSNCAINPCICFVFRGIYREGLKKVGCRAFKCNCSCLRPMRGRSWDVQS